MPSDQGELESDGDETHSNRGKLRSSGVEMGFIWGETPPNATEMQSDTTELFSNRGETPYFQ